MYVLYYHFIDPLQIQPWYGHILGGVPILISGPYFKEDDRITLSFDNFNMVECTYINSKESLCITPRLTKIGRVTVKLYQNNSRYEKTTNFYSSKKNDN